MFTGLYYYEQRYYDASKSTFLGVDAKAENYSAWSPYNYCGGNPIIRVDKNGEFWLQLGGAVLGAAVDYGGQVAANMVSGQSFTDALTHDISVGSILISAGEGALTSGGSVFKTAAKSTVNSVVKQGLKTALKEGAIGATGQVIDNAIDIAQGADKSIMSNVVDKAVTSAFVGTAVSAKGLKKADVDGMEKRVANLSKKSNPTSRQVNMLESTQKSLTSTQVTNTAKQVGNVAISNVAGIAKRKIEESINQ